MIFRRRRVDLFEAAGGARRGWRRRARGGPGAGSLLNNPAGLLKEVTARRRRGGGLLGVVESGRGSRACRPSPWTRSWRRGTTRRYDARLDRYALNAPRTRGRARRSSPRRRNVRSRRADDLVVPNLGLASKNIGGGRRPGGAPRPRSKERAAAQRRDAAKGARRARFDRKAEDRSGRRTSTREP